MTVSDTIRSNRKSALFSSLLLCLFSTAAQAVPTAAPTTLDDVILSSEQIVVATVLRSDSRWNDRGNLIVTDYQLAVSQVLKGEDRQTMTLTMGGGTVGLEGHSVSTSVPLTGDSRYLLFVEDASRQVFSPLAAGGTALIRERPDGNVNSGVLEPEAQAELKQLGRLSFDDLVTAIEVLSDELTASGRAPATVHKAQNQGLPRKQVITTTMQVTTELVDTLEVRANPYAPVPRMPALERKSAGEVVGSVNHGDKHRSPGNDLNYSWARRPNPPVVFNQLPDTFVWSPHDQFMMSEWNSYVGELFRVLVTPTGTWSWGDGQFDLAGFPSDADMIAQFGEPWSSGALGVTYSRWIGSGNIIESDVALNPARSWTLNNEFGTRSGNDVWSFERTMLHELGHAWGLHHPFDEQDVWWDSAMNYAPKSYRLPQLTTDDTNAVRDAYVSVARHDAALFHYRTSDRTDSTHARYHDALPPNEIYHGQLLTFSTSSKIENLGTDNIVNPEVQLYLTPQRMSWTGARYLGTTTLVADIPTFFTWYFNLSPELITTDILPGRYFSGLFFSLGDDDLGNNSSWSTDYSAVQVRNVPSTLSITEHWQSGGFGGAIAEGGYYEARVNLHPALSYDFSLCAADGGFASFDIR